MKIETLGNLQRTESILTAEDSVDLLQNSGIQFEKHEQEGIDPIAFAELMLMSGLCLMDNVKWLSFHSGYDFGYLVSVLLFNSSPMKGC